MIFCLDGYSVNSSSWPTLPLLLLPSLKLLYLFDVLAEEYTASSFVPGEVIAIAKIKVYYFLK